MADEGLLGGEGGFEHTSLLKAPCSTSSLAAILFSWGLRLAMLARCAAIIYRCDIDDILAVRSL